MDLKQRARQLKLDIPAVFLALGKKETPLIAKILGGITVAYALSPIDLIPDFIPLLGYLDDVIVLPVLIAWTIQLIPREVLEMCRQLAAHLWEDGRPKRWYYAIPIVLIWLLIGWLVLSKLVYAA